MEWLEEVEDPYRLSHIEAIAAHLRSHATLRAGRRFRVVGVISSRTIEEMVGLKLVHILEGLVHTVECLQMTPRFRSR